MTETLALVGLVMATILYALMVRRRAIVRFGAVTLSRALTASNEIALNRLHLSPRRRSAGATPELVVDGVIIEERRTGEDRRRPNERWRGRGRRSGGDRRRDASSV
jgi:hypothetical protein